MLSKCEAQPVDQPLHNENILFYQYNVEDEFEYYSSSKLGRDKACNGMSFQL